MQLSIGLVTATAAAVAATTHALGLTRPMAWVLGAALAPTDATAVSSVARRLPRRMRTTLKAESLVTESAGVGRSGGDVERQVTGLGRVFRYPRDEFRLSCWSYD
jgi:hypothetical protein